MWVLGIYGGVGPVLIVSNQRRRTCLVRARRTMMSQHPELCVCSASTVRGRRVFHELFRCSSAWWNSGSSVRSVAVVEPMETI